MTPRTLRIVLSAFVGLALVVGWASPAAAQQQNAPADGPADRAGDAEANNQPDSRAAADALATPGEQIRVGARVAPPFIMQGDDGSYHGLAIALLDEITSELDLTYELQEYDLAPLFDAAAAGEIDVAVGPLTITAEREQRVDFTHPYYASGLGIAVRDEGGIAWLTALTSLASPAFLSAVGTLAAILLITGGLMWLVERKKNEDQFGGHAAKGLGNGFWWSAVTMTTVGYGDKAPITPVGRVIALVWMFASVIIISSFTAAIATSLTLSSLGGDIQGPNDLAGKRIGALEGSTGAENARDRGARVRTFASGDEAINALAEGDVEAVVHDEPVLRWWISQSDTNQPIAVLPETFAPQDYGFATAEGDALREELNRAILEVTTRPTWRDRVDRLLEGGSD